VKEQHNFCAYTEKYLSQLDSVEIEHFNSAIKYSDDYYNYYAVIRKANLYKKDEQYKDASFFSSLFFQREFDKRIRYVPEDFVYEEIDQKDVEARDFIDFVGLKHPDLTAERKKHVARLQSIFDAIPDKEAYFRTHPNEMSFLSAIEAHFEIDLSNCYLIPFRP